MDASLGVGYKRYYLLYASDAKSLTPEPVDSDTSKTTYSSSEGAATDVIDLDFDMTLNTPQTVQGNLIFCGSYNHKATASGGGRTFYMRMDVYIYHVRGVTETLIGSKASGTYNSTTDTSDHSYRRTHSIALTKTSFAIGDKLRINVRVNAYRDVGDTQNITLYHDPTTRNQTVAGDGVFTTHDTDMFADVPFRINL